MDLRIADRRAAGVMLAAQLKQMGYRENLLILALPRGGVPVAYEIASELDAEMDVLIVRKLGLPRQREVAMGAIASGGLQFLNDELIQACRVPPTEIDTILREERAELERRERLYRGIHKEPLMKGRTVVLVDDGLATGASMQVAVDAVKRRAAQHVVIAVPVGAVRALDRLQPLVDRVVCLSMPIPFVSVSQWYHDFPQVSDEEVESLLQQGWRKHPAKTGKLKKVS